jgi:hypothetical protein
MMYLSSSSTIWRGVSVSFKQPPESNVDSRW